MKRTLTFNGKSYQVLKHSSSGLGDQFTAEWTNEQGKQQFVYLNPDTVLKDPSQNALFESCRTLFEQHPTLGNNIRLDGHFYNPKN